MGEQFALYDATAGGRLGPVEARAIIRRRLGRIAARWSLDPGDVYTLVRRMNSRSYSPGDVLVPQGVQAGCLGFIVRGQVAVQVGERASARPVVVLLPGSTFGEVMLEGGPSGATLQAITRCDVWYLRRAELQAIAKKRRSERRAATLQHLIRGSAVALVMVLVLLVALNLAPVRRSLAVVPMAVGEWCDQTGRLGCTREAWHAAANLASEDPNPLLALGTYYYQQGDVAAAERAFEAAGVLAPELPEVYNNLGLIYARQGDHERAIVAFEEALALEPGIATTEYNLGASLQALERYREALEHYQAAVALGQPQGDTLVNMAMAHYEFGEMAEAASRARQAIALNANLAPAHAILGAVAIASQQPEDALVHLERAVALDSEYGQAHFFLGLAYKALGQRSDAVTAFEQALARAGDEMARVRIRRHLNELYESQEVDRRN
jgi:tetratricopeptide (TPR) repeat protein